MNGIRRIRRLASVLAGLAGVLLASAAAVPAAFAGTDPIPDPPGYIGDPYIGTSPVAPVPATAVHVVNTGGMPGWQIALIAVGDARWRPRRGARVPGPRRPPPAIRSGCLSHARRSSGAASRRSWPAAPLRARPAGRPVRPAVGAAPVTGRRGRHQRGHGRRPATRRPLADQSSAHASADQDEGTPPCSTASPRTGRRRSGIHRPARAAARSAQPRDPRLCSSACSAAPPRARRRRAASSPARTR